MAAIPESVTAGKPRPLWRVILCALITGLAYYGYYKWVIEDELRRYRGEGWSGATGGGDSSAFSKLKSGNPQRPIEQYLRLFLPWFVKSVRPRTVFSLAILDEENSRTAGELWCQGCELLGWPLPFW